MTAACRLLLAAAVLAVASVQAAMPQLQPGQTVQIVLHGGSSGALLLNSSTLPAAAGFATIELQAMGGATPMASVGWSARAATLNNSVNPVLSLATALSVAIPAEGNAHQLFLALATKLNQVSVSVTLSLSAQLPVPPSCNGCSLALLASPSVTLPVAPSAVAQCVWPASSMVASKLRAATAPGLAVALSVAGLQTDSSWRRTLAADGSAVALSFSSCPTGSSGAMAVTVAAAQPAAVQLEVVPGNSAGMQTVVLPVIPSAGVYVPHTLSLTAQDGPALLGWPFVATQPLLVYLHAPAAPPTVSMFASLSPPPLFFNASHWQAAGAALTPSKPLMAIATPGDALAPVLAVFTHAQQRQQAPPPAAVPFTLELDRPRSFPSSPHVWWALPSRQATTLPWYDLWYARAAAAPTGSGGGVIITVESNVKVTVWAAFSSPPPLTTADIRSTHAWTFSATSEGGAVKRAELQLPARPASAPLFLLIEAATGTTGYKLRWRPADGGASTGRTVQAVMAVALSTAAVAWLATALRRRMRQQPATRAGYSSIDSGGVEM